MRKIVLAVAVAATLPSLAAADPPQQMGKNDVRRSAGGTKAVDKVSDKRKAGPATATGKVQKPGTKETIKLNQNKPAKNTGVMEPGKLEQNK